MSPIDIVYSVYRIMSDPSQREIYIHVIGLLWLHWSLYSVMFIGIGLWLFRFLRYPVTQKFDFITAFWLGWAVVIALLQVWHLYAPVSSMAAWLFFIVGLTGILIHSKHLIMFLKWHWNIKTIFIFTLFIVFFLLISGGSIDAPSNGDFALYHLQVIEWNKAYPIVTGLGNLHGRLAFNNSNFLYVSLMDVWLVPGIGSHIAASLLILFFFFFSLWGIHRLLIGDIRVSTIFATLTLPVIAWVVTKNEYLTTPDSDLIPILLSPIILIILLKILEHNTSSTTIPIELIIIILLSCIGVVSKLSFVIYAALSSLLALVFSKNLKPYHLLFISTFSLFVGGIWLIRGYLLSGYLLFPLHSLPFPVDWRVPCFNAIKEASLILSWARMPNKPYQEVLNNWNWLSPWFIRTLQHDFEVFTPLTIAIVSMLGLVLTRSFKNWDRILFSIGIPLCSLLFWFISAPDVRFAGSFFWVLANIILAILINQRILIDSRHIPFVVIMFVLVLSYERRLEFNLSFPSSENGFHTEPYPPLEQKTTLTGLHINFPIENDKCYRAALPCTPIWNPNLSYRIDGDLSSGFKNDDVDLSCPEQDIF